MSIIKSLPFGIAVCITALVSPFFFPMVLAMTAAAIAGFYLPIMPLVVGLTIDLLYYPGTHLPIGVIYGAIISLAILFVRYIARTRIM